MDHDSTTDARINGRRVVRPGNLPSSDILQVGTIEIMYERDDGKDSNCGARTQTGIRLRDSADAVRGDHLDNFSPFRTGSQRKRDRSTLPVILTVLITVLLGICIVLGMSLVQHLMG